MKLSDFLNWLDSYLNFEKQQKKGIFWLESMRFLCGKLGNPQNDVPCIHIAGSKGKGSVSKMIACILNEAGYSCGLYMSPHISDFRERIGTAEGFFSDKVYEDAGAFLPFRQRSFLEQDSLPGLNLLRYIRFCVSGLPALILRCMKQDLADGLILRMSFFLLQV